MSVSPTTTATAYGTVDRRHSHFNRVLDAHTTTNPSVVIATTSNNFPFVRPTTSSRQSDDSSSNDDSISAQATQPISLTSFVNSTIDDNVGTSSRQTRRRNNNSDRNSGWQSRTRYGGRPVVSYRTQDEDIDDGQPPSESTTTNNHHPPRVLSESDGEEEEEEEEEETSHNKRTRIERGDRRISVSRHGYDVGSDEPDEDERPAANDSSKRDETIADKSIGEFERKLEYDKNR